MKRFFLMLAGFFLLAVGLGFGLQTNAQIETTQSIDSAQVSSNVVISQFFGGGGLTNAPYTNDFVELFNRGNTAVDLNGWSVQYASSSGTNWLVTPLPNFTLEPGQYYLIQYASNGSAGSALPTPDFVAPLVTEGYIPNLSSTSGKLAVVNSAIKLPASTCPSGDPLIIDLVGYGAAASCSEGTKTPDLSVTTAGKRNTNGCEDTDNNAQNFTIGIPTPRNSGSPKNSCNFGAALQAGGAANPNTVAPGASTLLTVSVIPATTPPSTNVTVVGNLTNIGGAASQQFYDNGTNGDVTANDNVFSYSAMIPAAANGGTYNVTAVASDAQGRAANVAMSLTINAPFGDEDPLLLGNPSNATANVANENNYLMVKPQYTLSYNRSKAEANWVAWRLDSTWIGSTPRQDDFRPDPQLPAGWYQVLDTDYSGSGYDRGHMTPSGDRTRSVLDNSATFLMTNIIPQLAANNQGPWNDFENYCRSLVSQGNELYIFSGGAGVAGTISQGRIVVPQVTWKVVLVLPKGNNDLQRISKATRAIAIIIPNQPPLTSTTPWRNFRTSVEAVEVLTGYDFFSNVPKNTQEIIERRRDRE